MALTKTVSYDSIDVHGDLKWVKCRRTTTIKEDGVTISRVYHRHVLQPSTCEADYDSDGNADGTFTHTDTDISGETAEIQAICNAAWTDEVKAAFKTWGESLPYPPTNT